MGFKSKAQREKFKELLSQGKVSQEVFDEFERTTPTQIPDRLASNKPFIVGMVKVIGQQKVRRRKRR